MKTKNLVELVSNTVEKYPEHIAMIWRSGEQEESMTYHEFWNLIRKFAFGLEKLGVRSGMRIAILAHNHPYWLICDIAILSLGAVSVPINPNLSKQQTLFLLDDVDIEMVIADTAEHYYLFNSLSSINQHMIVLFDQENKRNHIYSFQSVCQMGEEWTSEWGYHFIRSHDLASIVHTLGTTSSPKGVMLTHGNLVHNIQSISRLVPISRFDVVTSLSSFAFLPERIVNFFYAIYQGATLVFTDSHQQPIEKLQICKPTFLLSVPRVFQEIYLEIHEDIETISWVKKRLFTKAIEVAKERAVYTDRGYLYPVPKEIQKKFERVDQQIFAPIREQLGGQLRLMLSFGAPLPEEISRFFGLINLPILTSYGLTESASLIACNHPLQIHHETVGQALPGVTTKLLTDGELIVRSESVMLGYYKRPELTTQTIIDGWLHTGDYAKIDDKGFLQILPQPKRHLYLQNGQKINPEPMEKSITTSPFIYQAFIVGNQRRYVTALIIPDFEVLALYAKESGFPFSDRDDLIQSQTLQSLIQAEMDEALEAFPGHEQPKRFVLLKEELTLEKGELTIHGHFRVAEVEDKYRKLIEAMYT